jgi:acyl-CoA hydrolase
MKSKLVSESAIDDQTTEIFPNDLNAYGTVFGGRILEIADMTAAIVAKRHSGKICVTLGIDSVRFLAPAGHGDILVFQSAVNRTWRTSLEVGIKVHAENFRTREQKHILSAYFTFVALSDDLKPVEIDPVTPITEDEKRRFEAADLRRQARLKKA